MLERKASRITLVGAQVAVETPSSQGFSTNLLLAPDSNCTCVKQKNSNELCGNFETRSKNTTSHIFLISHRNDLEFCCVLLSEMRTFSRKSPWKMFIRPPASFESNISTSPHGSPVPSHLSKALLGFRSVRASRDITAEIPFPDSDE